MKTDLGFRGRILFPIAVIALLGAMFYTHNPMARGAQAYARDVAASSAGIYLTLRSLNAFLSTAQEVEVGGSLVVQGSAQPFKVLEPVDDTVERIASVVFYVMVVTGVLAVAMGPVSAVGFVMLLAACGIGVWRGARGGTGAALARKLGTYGAFFAIAVPLAFILSSVLADRMTAGVWQDHHAVLTEITAAVSPEAEVDTDGTSLWSMVSGSGDTMDRYRTMAANTYNRADELVASLIAILAVFLFKVLVLPLLLLGGCLSVARVLSGAADAAGAGGVDRRG
ncbi:hypothetical protein [Cognatishimia sp. F0-27]|uniref:hypothetical protein n=1 Tax=Cognatishimia sp. F0-27 TaxID=2816855 RepID=UPI001D0C6B4B|nr:hypothetical protein [Cognatishimia sp. F0-27]MCC1491683.1 hypothetical protein [Cognatishimia sp. F0-27]